MIVSRNSEPVTEEAVQFGDSASLVGVLTRPSGTGVAKSDPAFVILNSGIAHRVGTGRLYVRMARHFASLGFASLRFDFSGVGDSRVRTDRLSFEESLVKDTQEAMNFLQEVEGFSTFVLTGICRGGDVSFQTAAQDNRVAGVVLMNHSFDYGEEIWQHIKSRSTARFIWQRALFSPSHWRKLLRGKVQLSMLGAPLRYLLGGSGSKRKEAAQAVAGHLQNLHQLLRRRVRLLLVYSEFDPGLDAFRMAVEPSLRNAETTESMRLEVIQASDHTFTLVDSQQRLLTVIGEWTDELAVTGEPAAHLGAEMLRA